MMEDGEQLARVNSIPAKPDKRENFLIFIEFHLLKTNKFI